MAEIKFKYVDAPYGCFSNFSKHPIKVDGTLYLTTEHYYQSKKMINKEDAEFIVKMPSPKLAAEFGRKRPKKENWEEIKVSIMEEALRHKLEQHPIIKKVLLGTGEDIIIEDSSTDKFWGKVDNIGENNLGNLWMKLRKELIDDRKS